MATEKQLLDLEIKRNSQLEKLFINEYDLSELENNEAVKQYIQLSNQQKELYKEFIETKKEINNLWVENRLENCDHVLIHTNYNYDYSEKHRSICACIKCGMNEDLYQLPDEALDEKELVIKNYMLKHKSKLKGTDSKAIIIGHKKAQAANLCYLYQNYYLTNDEDVIRFAKELQPQMNRIKSHDELIKLIDCYKPKSLKNQEDFEEKQLKHVK